MTFGALAFLSPWLLTGLAALPLIYWLLRTVPPRPRQISFPPTRILVGLENREQTAATTPWWLLLLRLLAAALLILALADPVLNPSREKPLAGSGPLVLVIDNGWASAARWSERVDMAENLIGSAERNDRPVVIVPTAAAAKTVTIKIESPVDARSTLAALLPQPFAPDRTAALTRLQSVLGTTPPGGTAVAWISDGIAHAPQSSKAFADGLASLATSGAFALIEDTGEHGALALTAEVGASGKLTATVHRAGGPKRAGVLIAYSARDEQLGEAAFDLAAGAVTATAEFTLPLELRNQITRIAIQNHRSAGAVHLLDARDQWHRVALFSGESAEQSQPLLGPLHYIEKALTPFSEIVRPRNANLAESVSDALDRNAGIFMMADIGTLEGETAEKVRDWVTRGGVLVRFAGPRLEKGSDDLLPAPLRLGGRTLGGALSWSKPQPLAAFSDDSPFAGLTVPQEVLINRQVLADPTQLTGETAIWARLEDGTPLVTARKLGEGQLVLFHVTANSDWSNLPLSGLFVDMLRRVNALARIGGGSSSDGSATSAAAGSENTSNVLANLAPNRALDGFGALRQPPPTARALKLSELGKTAPSLDHPPGYYGPGSNPRSLNVIKIGDTLTALQPPSAADVRGFAIEAATRLKPWLLATALALLLVDVLAILLLQAGGRLFGGRLPSARTASMVAATLLLPALLIAAMAASTTPSFAQGSDRPPSQAAAAALDTLSEDEIRRAAKATEKVTIGYVLTGDEEVDQISRTGLAGLGRILSLRTAITPGMPMPVDIENDVIAFFPVLYWPVIETARELQSDTVAKIDAYMKQGGMIIFDTRDHGLGTPSSLGLSASETPLQRILKRLDLPRLEPVPDGHVLTKSFYLLRSFPGRWNGGQMWVEAGAAGTTGSTASRQAQRADGVSSILITSNDLAAAWAIDDRGRPFYPAVPGGERQREMAFRTGVNIVMHALTGNYKADQVHVPALLERLGQ